MILPAGNRKRQVAQSMDQFREHVDLFASIDPALLEKLAAYGTDTINPPGQKPGAPSQSQLSEAIKRPATTDHNVSKGQGLDPNANLGLAGQSASSIAPAGHTPIKAQPSGTVDEQQLDPSQEPNFWEQLAAAISPFLEQRNLQLAATPKMIDRNRNIYELLLAPQTDPQSGQPMQLPNANIQQLFQDANLIAQAAKGRIDGLPHIDPKGVWHIPLAIGGGQKPVSKQNKKAR